MISKLSLGASPFASTQTIVNYCVNFPPSWDHSTSFMSVLNLDSASWSWLARRAAFSSLITFNLCDGCRKFREKQWCSNSSKNSGFFSPLANMLTQEAVAVEYGRRGWDLCPRLLGQCRSLAPLPPVWPQTLMVPLIFIWASNMAMSTPGSIPPSFWKVRTAFLKPSFTRYCGMF